MENFAGELFTKLYETAFANTYFGKKSPVICHQYKATSAQMTEEDFKKEISLLKAHICEYQAKGLFSDTREFYFPITPELQVWINEYMLSDIPTVGKIAVMVSPDFIAQLSVEQTIEENKEISLQTRFFTDSSKALDWLAKH